MRTSPQRLIVPLFAATLFLSSFLMFAIEPLVAKRMLPVLGGAPMVWNGCVVFFQTVLLVGYGTAHVLTRWFGPSRRLLVYSGLAMASLGLLHLNIDTTSAASATSAPLAWLLSTLVSAIGAAFLVLAISASVLQSSLASSGHDSAHDPYFLYVASNAGSLAALIAYPLVIEPWLGLGQQASVWALAYFAFACLLLVCAVVSRFALGGPASARVQLDPADASPARDITWRDRVRWCVLACLPSSLMLGVTTLLTTDVAPIPLLWVVPLALYLLTFIVAFSRWQASATALANRLFPIALLPLSVIMLLHFGVPIAVALVLHLVPFFLAALLCHGQLALSRPHARHLTEFYFWLAFGGMVGGLFNTLFAPMLFSRVVEYPLALAVVTALRPASPTPVRWSSVDVWLPVGTLALIVGLHVLPVKPESLRFVLPAMAALVVLTLARSRQRWTYSAVVGAMLLASPWASAYGASTLYRERTFFGIYAVTDDHHQHHVLTHGTTIHGMQSLDPRRRDEPLTYYHRTGPFGDIIAAGSRWREPAQIGAIGLGVGTLAAYRAPQRQWTFYEIDPAVERIARTDRWFTFLADCGAACRVILGDARLSLAADRDTRYQLIVLDAFSSDAIPMHLLTNDAMRVYLAHLAPHGLLAFHISNRHLALSGVVGRLGAANGLAALDRLDIATGSSPMPDKTSSEWVVMGRSHDDLGPLAQSPAWSIPPVTPATPLWTDDFSSILGVIRFGS